MAEMQWEPGYSVGVVCCDCDHQRVFAMINELDNAMRAGSGQLIVEDILARLEAYACLHFRTEEELMARALYLQLDEHRREHAQFAAMVKTLRRQLADGAIALSVDVSYFLNDWWSNHILHADKLYTERLNAAGIR